MPAAGELVAERAQQQVGVGGGHDLRWMAPHDRPAARLHPHRGELGAGDRGARRTLPSDRARHPRATAAASEREPVTLEAVIGDVARLADGRVHARRLLDGRADRAARGAGAAARPGRAPGADRRAARGSRTIGRARGAAARPTRRWRTRSSRRRSRSSRGAGRRHPGAGWPAAERARSAVHADRLRNTPAGLARALRGLGTGALPSLWERLGELTMPVTLIVGERDAKFRAIAERDGARRSRTRRGASFPAPATPSTSRPRPRSPSAWRTSEAVRLGRPRRSALRRRTS